MSNSGHSKRSISVTVKMSAEDLKLLERAAGRIWPKASVTKSSMVLWLSKMGAETVLKKG